MMCWCRRCRDVVAVVVIVVVDVAVDVVVVEVAVEEGAGRKSTHSRARSVAVVVCPKLDRHRHTDIKLIGGQQNKLLTAQLKSPGR